MSKFDQKNQRVNTQLNADKINIGIKPITCPDCQNGNPSNAKYCSQCGASLTFKCPLCKSETPLGGRFCLGCGKEIARIDFEIQEAKRKRGGDSRELVYEFRSKPFNSFSLVDQLTTVRNNARITLSIDEYVARKEDVVVFYKGETQRREAEGCLHLTNKRLIFLGKDAESGISRYENPYALDEISEVSVQSDKMLFISSSYLKIIWNGNIRRFSFGREAVTESWVESINARLHGNNPSQEHFNKEDNSLYCPKCGLPFKTEENRKLHMTNWHK